jgi:citrate lyase alpha subunit
MVGHPIARHIPHRHNKVTTLDQVIDVFLNGDTISYPHYYHTGDSRAKDFGVTLVSIEELHKKLLDKAAGFSKTPRPKPTTDEVAHIIEWRDGTILDTVRTFA